jgi:hypothetical protein
MDTTRISCHSPLPAWPTPPSCRNHSSQQQSELHSRVAVASCTFESLFNMLTAASMAHTTSGSCECSAQPGLPPNYPTPSLPCDTTLLDFPQDLEQQQCTGYKRSNKCFAPTTRIAYNSRISHATHHCRHGPHHLPVGTTPANNSPNSTPTSGQRPNGWAHV